MSRDRSPYVAQGTWRSGALHVWGWNGDGAASAAWLYSGFGRSRWDAEGGWHDSPVSFGELSRLQLELPDGGQRFVPTVRLDPYGAAVWLSDTPKGDELSPSLAWFASLVGYAVQVVNARRLIPEIGQEGPFTVVRWKPILDAAGADAVAHAAAVAPPICRNGSPAATEDILSLLVDGFARSVLHHAGWKPDLGRKRSIDVQATRAVFAALAKPDAVIRTGTDDFEVAVEQLGHGLARHRRRLGGEPVVRGRVRLTLPDDALDPWLVDLELVDDSNPGKWCTADDVWSKAPRAVDLAGSVGNLDQLRQELITLTELICPTIPPLAPLLLEHEPSGIELTIEDADDFLDVAPAELERRGIELLGPEHLVSSKVRVRGEARESTPDDRQAKFGKEALVEWSAVIDDTPISAADLARAEAAGVTLMRAGHRWVRIDPAGLRRARQLLDEHLAHKSRVGAIDLLKFSAGHSPDGQTPVELSPVELSPVELSAAGFGTDGLGVFDADHDPLAADDPVVDQSWIRSLLAGLPDEGLQEVQESAGFHGELRHYQRRGLAWMQFLAGVGLGGCLADDMGLGKTATTLAHLLERPGPHLVVCPLSVVHNWEAEANRFAPSLSVLVHHGTSRQRTEAVDPTDDTTTDSTIQSAADEALFELPGGQEVPLTLAEADLVITTYGLLPRDLADLSAVEWSTVVLDEAQMVKNASTKAAKAVRRLQAGQKLALTGTPVENRLSELWAILDAVNPGLLGSLQRFREEYAGPIERNGDGEVAARLRSLTGPFVLRRTKADRRLLPDLPDKIEQIAYAQLTREQATLYQQVVDQLLVDAKDLEGMARRGRVLAAITRLKQICNHPAHALKDGSRLAGRSGKLNRFDELLTDVVDIEERALVFTQFREMGDLLAGHLVERFGIRAPFLHGGVSRAARDRMVAEFQAGEHPLLLVSLKAGGTGLNLTAASQVIHYDRWWNPAVEDQATDRAWRMGQERTVNVHKLVCQGTVEERIGAVIDEKRAIADAVIGTGEGWISEMSTDELAHLVSLGGGA
ncbi:MAG TPA: DEAD/DEAH box helicase [Ilumatobacter sp.]|nr:DEAD/DEAH box helicase [Ilumatobacter sp.]